MLAITPNHQGSQSYEEPTMTVTANTSNKGKHQRKSLASQLDHFDNMLDGLDQALKEVIADTVREAVT